MRTQIEKGGREGEKENLTQVEAKKVKQEPNHEGSGRICLLTNLDFVLCH